jgi:RES domain-containing protein
MKVFRLQRSKYGRALSGHGAAIAGGRWNSKGTEMIYTSESRALAFAEVLVHLSVELLPDDFVMLEIDLPDDIAIRQIAEADLSKNWNLFPPSDETMKIGDRFVENNKFCVLKVPSAVVEGDHNYLINPDHSLANGIRVLHIKKFLFDRRLF